MDNFSLNNNFDLILNGHNLGYSYRVNPGIIIMPWAAEMFLTKNNLFRENKIKKETKNPIFLREYNEWLKFASSVRNYDSEEEFNFESKHHYIGCFQSPSREFFEWNLKCEHLKLQNISRKKDVVVLKENELEEFVLDFRKFINKNKKYMPIIPVLARNIIYDIEHQLKRFKKANF